jgi:hypothetical protein
LSKRWRIWTASALSFRISPATPFWGTRSNERPGVLSTLGRGWEQRLDTLRAGWQGGMVDQLTGGLIARSRVAICDQINFLRANGYF